MFLPEGVSKFSITDLGICVKKHVTKTQLKKAALGNEKELKYISDICSAFIEKAGSRVEGSALSPVMKKYKIDLEKLYQDALKLSLFILKTNKKQDFPIFLHRVMKNSLANRILTINPEGRDESSKLNSLTLLKLIDRDKSCISKSDRDFILRKFANKKLTKEAVLLIKETKEIYGDFLKSEFFKNRCILNVGDVTALYSALNVLTGKFNNNEHVSALCGFLDSFPLSSKISAFLEKDTFEKLRELEQNIFKSFVGGSDREITFKNGDYLHSFIVYSKEVKANKKSTFYFRHFKDKFYISKEGKIILAKGSRLPANPTNTENTVKTIRHLFAKEDLLVLDEKKDELILQKDIAFPSLNLMFRFVQGRNASVMVKQEMLPPVSKKQIARLKSNLEEIPLQSSRILQIRGFNLQTQKEILLKFYGLFDKQGAKTYEELAKEYDLAYSTVSQLIKKIVIALFATSSKTCIRQLSDYLSKRKDGLISREVPRSELLNLMKRRSSIDLPIESPEEKFYINNHYGRAWGIECGDKFMVLAGSVAPACLKNASKNNKLVNLQSQLIEEGIISKGAKHCTFIKSYIFPSKATARAFVKGATGKTGGDWSCTKIEFPDDNEKQFLADLLSSMKLTVRGDATLSENERKEIFDKIFGLTQATQCPYEIFEKYQDRFKGIRFKPIYRAVLETLKQMQKASTDPAKVKDIAKRLAIAYGLKIGVI